LIVIVLAMVAGCRGDGGTTGEGRKPLNVFFLLISTKQVEFYQWAERQFEAANPDVDVIFEQFPGTSLKDYEIKIRLRYASGDPPDVWYFRENLLAEFVDLDLLAEAPPHIERIVQENSLNEMIRQAPYFDGICYGIAHNAAWQALYYNKDMFREAGLDPERPPETWDELLDYAELLTARRADGGVERAGISLRKTGYSPGTAEKWLTFFYSAGGTPFDADGSKSLFDSEAGRATNEFYEEVFRRKLDSVEHEGDQQDFGQGRVAMFIRELHVVDWMRTNYPNVNFGVAKIPVPDTSFTSYSSGGSYPFVVSKGSDVEETAWRFIEFLMSDEPYTKYMQMLNELPMLKSVAALPEFSEDPYVRTFLEQPVYIPPKFPHDKRSLGILGAYIERLAYGHLTSEEMLERATHDIDAHLRTNRERRQRTDGL
jgi:multiple sugar transport system substrate-binding protein